MQKKFIQFTSMIIAIAMFFTIIVAFSLQTLSSLTNAKDEIALQLTNVQKQIQENAQSVEELKKNLKEDYLAKTRAFSYMIKQNPELVNSPDELTEILKQLDVDELHITDENGIIQWGTVPDYINFDMRDSEQTKEFIPILNDSTKEVAQDPQLNGTKNILFQYIGVSRQDKPGIVQIGMQPKRLETALENNRIENVMAHSSNSTYETLFAIDKATGTVAYFPDASLIGKTSQEIGLGTDFSTYVGAYEKCRINGKNLYISAAESENYILFVGIDYSSIFSNRNIQLFILILSDIAVIIVLTLSINRLLKTWIVDKINLITADLGKIEKGDLSTIVDVRTCREFSVFSDGINAMVESLKLKMEESKKLLEKQSATARQIEERAHNIETIINRTRATSENIASGSTEQASSIEKLTQNIGDLSRQMQADHEKAMQATGLSNELGQTLMESVSQCSDMLNAMGQLNEMSQEIQNVVASIDSISSQTNMLALNAAVEAARAGSAGMGFAVVADEVRALAGKSANAAKQTAEMIGHTVEIIQSGSALAEATSASIQKVLDSAKQAADLTKEIANASDSQTQIIHTIEDSSRQVNSVAQNNTELATEGRDSIEDLLTEIHGLRMLTSSEEDSSDEKDKA